MKATDLMIGDWVNIQTEKDDEPMYSQVEQLLECEIDADFQTSYENVYPIPLTEEILEKNGFEHEDGVGYIYDDYETSNKVIVDMWDGTIKILHNYDIAFNRTYWRTVNVHELQHILKDLEIEKEIIL